MIFVSPHDSSMFSPLTSRALSRATTLTPLKPVLIYPPCRHCLLSTVSNTTAGSNSNTYSTREPNDKPRTIFSGIQPTGIPHLGNYLGALKPWAQLQNSAQPNDRLIFSIVDLHAITAKHDPKQLIQWRRDMMAAFIGVGLDPERSIIFSQSEVPAHSEMMWVLSCMSSMGYLNRMTQWKSKLGLREDFDSDNDFMPRKKVPNFQLALFSYPVLQAADILLYRASHVPVGEDQAQHLEFARSLAATYNRTYGPDRMVLPETIISPAKRIMSLQDPTKKMSKSEPKIESRILINDPPEEITRKIKSALTDSLGDVDRYDPKLRPGVSNLLEILFHLGDGRHATVHDLAEELCAGETTIKQLKDLVMAAVENELAPVRERLNEALSWSDRKMYDTVKKGDNAAKSIADARIKGIKEDLGLTWGYHGL